MQTNVNVDLSHLPGRTGAEEGAAALQGGGFGWSLARAEEYGPACRTVVRGQDAVLLTGTAGMAAFYDPQNVERASAKGPEDVAFLSDGRTPVVPVLDGAAHLKRKQNLLKIANPGALQNYFPILDSLVQEAMQRWETLGVFDLKEQLKAFGFQALSRLITGFPGDAENATDVGSTLMGAFGADPTPHLPARDRLLQWYRTSLNALRAEPASQAGRCMMGVMAHQTDMTDDQIIAEVQHLFIGSAGFWAVSCNSLVTLASSPTILQKARACAIETGMNPTTWRDTDYLQLFIEEVLRISPVINSQLGRSIRDFEVGGQRVPKGALVVAGFFATNHLSSLFPDPHVFNPERAVVEANASGQAVCPFSSSKPFAYVPFGGGNRATGHRCAGEPFLYLSVRILLTRALAQYNWEIINATELKTAPAAYLAPVVKARFETRI